ncbi:MAG: peptidylprolyl isomerase [Acidobacteria bacterium]|nr:peptidylprolyl isomerase [Acidobacteriota bacterium]
MIRIAPLLVVLTLAACSRNTPAAATSQETAAATPASTQATSAAPATPAAPTDAPPAAAPVPAQLPEVVARVNGEAISKAELEAAVGELVARAGRPLPPEQRDSVFRGVLDDLIGLRLLKSEGAARKIVVPEAEIDARIAGLKSQFPSEAAFTQMLTARGMTLAKLRSEARDSMQVDTLLRSQLKDATITPEQVTAFYNENPSDFQQGERVRASHILIGVPEGADPATKQLAFAKAAEVLGQVKAGGDFAALAKQHSSDPGSAPAGGDLGFFERGQMVGPFEQAAFSLAPSQTSEIVESPFGYHIIKVAEKQAARTVPIAEVRAQIQEFLQSQSRQQQAQAFVQSLRAKGKIEVLI